MIQQDVLWFNVPVNHFIAVHKRHGFTDFNEDVHELTVGQSRVLIATEVIEQVALGTVLEEEVDPVGFLVNSRGDGGTT